MHRHLAIAALLAATVAAMAAGPASAGELCIRNSGGFVMNVDSVSGLQGDWRSAFQKYWPIGQERCANLNGESGSLVIDVFLGAKWACGVSLPKDGKVNINIRGTTLDAKAEGCAWWELVRTPFPGR